MVNNCNFSTKNFILVILKFFKIKMKFFERF